MDFTFTDDHAQLRDAVRGFLRRKNDFSARTKSARSESGWSESLWRGLARELGILGLFVPERLAGASGDAVDAMVIMEELGASLLVEPFLETAIVGAAALNASDGRDVALRAIAQGDMRLALAWAEPDARFDRLPRSTTARRDGDGWWLDGRKAVVTAAPMATHLLVTALADGEPMLFLVDPDAPGVALRPFPTIDGRRAADIDFTRVRLPASSPVLRGAEAIERLLDLATALIGAEALGVLRCMFDDTIAFTKGRSQFGQPIASFQVIQHRLVDMYMRLELATSAVYRAVLSVEAAPAERMRAVSAMKVTVADACRFVGQNAIQLHGGMGMTDEVAVTHYFRRATAIECEFGSADYHRRRFASLSRAA